MLDAAVGTLFGELGELNFSLTDMAGWVAGTAAADMAELAVDEKLPFVTASDVTAFSGCGPRRSWSSSSSRRGGLADRFRGPSRPDCLRRRPRQSC